MQSKNWTCPADRLDALGVKSLQTSYEEQCNPEKTKVVAEFIDFYNRSQMSIKDVAQVAKLSRDQFDRLKRGTHLPPADQLARARQILSCTVGGPDKSFVLKYKRQETISTLLNCLNIPRISNKSDGFQLDQVEELSRAENPPEHSVLTDQEQYGHWINEVSARLSTSTQNVDAIGNFFYAREFLPGFVQQIIDCCIELKDSSAAMAADARKLYEEVGKLNLFHHCIRNSDGLQKAYKSVTKLFKCDHRDVNAESRLCEIARQWNLDLSDFQEPGSTVGFLLMQSSSLRQLVLATLKNSSYYPERQRSA